jgi:hypothetical protein
MRLEVRLEVRADNTRNDIRHLRDRRRKDTCVYIYIYSVLENEKNKMNAAKIKRNRDRWIIFRPGRDSHMLISSEAIN